MLMHGPEEKHHICGFFADGGVLSESPEGRLGPRGFKSKLQLIQASSGPTATVDSCRIPAWREASGRVWNLLQLQLDVLRHFLILEYMHLESIIPSCSRS